MEIGTVIKLLEKNKVLIKLDKLHECGNCAGKEFCNFMTKGEKTITAAYQGNLNPGDKVSIDFNPKARIIWSVIIFIFPIISMILFYLLGMHIFHNELISALAGFAGLVCTFAGIFLWLKLNKNPDKYIPRAKLLNNQ